MEKHEKGELSPQQKAKELLQSMMMSTSSVINFTTGDMDYLPQNQYAKQCALIAVENEYNAKIKAYNELYEFCPDVVSQAVFYAKQELKEVKTEIEKL